MIRKEIDKIIEYLEGTSKTLTEACELFNIDEDLLTSEELEAIDSEIFQCAECGWWVEIGDSNDKDSENVCSNCIE